MFYTFILLASALSTSVVVATGFSSGSSSRSLQNSAYGTFTGFDDNNCTMALETSMYLLDSCRCDVYGCYEYSCYGDSELKVKFFYDPDGNCTGSYDTEFLNKECSYGEIYTCGTTLSDIQAAYMYDYSLTGYNGPSTNITGEYASECMGTPDQYYLSDFGHCSDYDRSDVAYAFTSIEGGVAYYDYGQSCDYLNYTDMAETDTCMLNGRIWTDDDVADDDLPYTYYADDWNVTASSQVEVRTKASSVPMGNVFKSMTAKLAASSGRVLQDTNTSMPVGDIYFTIDSLAPTSAPSAMPSFMPSKSPTDSPTKSPTGMPTMMPTKSPSANPSFMPSKSPSMNPTSMPTSMPVTMAPTMMPTMTPTSSDANFAPFLMFASNLTIGGVVGFAGSDDEIYVLTASIALIIGEDIETVTINYIYEDGIKVYPVVSMSSQVKQSLNKLGLGGISRRLQSGELIVDFEVVVQLASEDAAEAYYTTLSDLLMASITSGAMTSAIEDFALEAGVVSLESATADSIDVGEYEVVYEEVDDDDNKDDTLDVLNDGAIAGIAIGAVVAFIIIVGVVFYMLGKKSGSSSGSGFGSDGKMSPVPSADDKNKVELLQLN